LNPGLGVLAALESEDAVFLLANPVGLLAGLPVLGIRLVAELRGCSACAALSEAMRCHAAFCSFAMRLYSAMADWDFDCSLAEYIAMPVEAAAARTDVIAIAVIAVEVATAILERLDKMNHF